MKHPSRLKSKLNFTDATVAVGGELCSNIVYYTGSSFHCNFTAETMGLVICDASWCEGLKRTELVTESLET